MHRDHDDTLGGTASLTPCLDSAREVYAGIAGMRRSSRFLVALAAALMRRIVLHWPGLTGGIACGQVWAELEAATEAHEARLARFPGNARTAQGTRSC